MRVSEGWEKKKRLSKAKKPKSYVNSKINNIINNDRNINNNEVEQDYDDDDNEAGQRR